MSTYIKGYARLILLALLIIQATAQKQRNVGDGIPSTIPAVLPTTTANEIISPSVSAAKAFAEPMTIDSSVFASSSQLEQDVDSICSGGLRMPGSSLHKSKLKWFEKQLKAIPGLQLSSYEYSLLGWEPLAGRSLEQAGGLWIDNSTSVEIASAVSYSKPTEPRGVSGQLVYLPAGTSITPENAKGKIVIRDIDFPNEYPYAVVLLPSYSNTGDFSSDLLKTYKRPSVAPTLLLDMVNATTSGAAGVITVFDVPRKYMSSYFTPHDGTHYGVPGVFVGVDEGQRLKAAAKAGKRGRIAVHAQVYNTTTRNIYATLPGQVSEQIVYVSHTDGATYVQENGGAALLSLARYFSKVPLAKRGRTLTFAFNTGHLHLSREGSDILSHQYDKNLDTNNVTLVIPMEHMGTREIEQYPRNQGLPGYDLKYTGKGEAMIWSVGPTDVVIKAVQDAVKRRNLDRSIVTRGASLPNFFVVPTFTSFAGLGTYFHTRLVPTTSLISGPWSLWAPSWGKDAVDYLRLRAQTLALGDVYFGVASATKQEILGGYASYREARENGFPQYQLYIPPEQL